VISPAKLSAHVESAEFQEAMKLAQAFSMDLERSKDFRAVQKYFRRDYVDRYLTDNNHAWFGYVDPATMAKANQSDLQSHYLALMNITYLGVLHFLSEPHHLFAKTDDDNPLPPDLLKLIEHHPYSTTYRKNGQNFDYLAEKIDSVPKLKSYTDLLEQINAYFFRQLSSRPRDVRRVLRKLEGPARGLEDTVCVSECLGLKKGTRLWEVDVPVFHLQLTKIRGRMQIVSARPHF